MPRKFLSPQLFQSKIKLGRSLGIGQQGGEDSQLVREAQIADKGKTFFGARKQYLSVNARDNRVVAIKAWRRLKRAGLPVPGFFRINLKKGADYLAVYMEDMQKLKGRLIETHSNGRPEKFRNLNVKEHKLLIKALAKDLGTIYGEGLYCPYIDFWHFYKTAEGNIDRVILDLESFKLTPKNNTQTAVKQLNSNLHMIRNKMDQREYLIFFEELTKSKFYKENKKEINPLGVLIPKPEPSYATGYL